ncbi:MAG: ABC transporter ATP-binding protein [Cyclobacteriaceae bacterium]|nr:ABC transporter ATP-binding protein [Cyclobacteriaceae bacterium]
MKKPQISAEKLAVGYGIHGEAIVLRDIHVRINPGEFICFLGANGSGKSTLLRTLSGLQPPLAGEVILQGIPLQQYNIRTRSRKISVVLTDPVYGANLTVEQLVELGRYPYTQWNISMGQDDQAMIEKALSEVGIQDIRERPLGELSDGQRQRVVIARAIAQAADIMLLDEPLHYLDLKNKIDTLKMLRRLAHEQGKAILMTSHELELALQLADRLWVIMPDATICEGVPEDLLLQGVLNEAFPADGYDIRTGKVRYKKGTEAVQVKGQGLQYEWTVKALLRKGYLVTAEPASLGVDVGKDSWIISHRGKQEEVNSIAAMLTVLA